MSSKAIIKAAVRRLIKNHDFYDIQFTQAGTNVPGKVQSLLNLKLLKDSDKGTIIARSVTVTGLGADIEEAQANSLETAVDLLGF